ncbi:MAG: hypothetical protein ACO1PW_13835, partial [Actinomycetota bacterium]
MRLLQLVTDDDHLLDLHPRVSVVRSPDPAVRTQLVEAVAGLARNEAAGTGLLEAHGVLFDLDPALLSLLDRRAEVDPVITSRDLPGGGRVEEALLRERQAEFDALLSQIAAAVEARQSAAGAVEAAAAALQRCEAAHADLVARQGPLEVEAAARRAEIEAHERQAQAARYEREETARRALVEAADERAGAAEALALAQRAHADAASRHDEAAAEVARLRAEHDLLVHERDRLQARLRPEAAAELVSALADLQVSASGPEPGPEGAVDLPEGGSDAAPTCGPASEVDDEEALNARVAILEEVLAELEGLDPLPVQAALAEARSPVELVPSDEASALADRIAALDEQISAAEADGVPDLSAEESAALAEALEAARAAVADAEDAARSHALRPEDAVALEAAHAALHDALERGESRLGGARARAKIDRLRAAEQELLDRLGFVTYAEYLMGTSSVHRRPEEEAALADARDRLAELEAAWADVEARRRAVLAHGQLLDQRRREVEAAQGLLGAAPDGDLVAALRSVLRPAVDVRERALTLGRALAAVGIDLDEADLELDDLEAIAEAWLAETASIEERRASLRSALEEATAALEAARAEDGGLEDGSSEPGPSEPEGPGEASPPAPALADGREEAVLALEAAQDRWEAHETATAALDGCEQAIDRLRAVLEAAEVALEGARAATAAADAAGIDAERSVAAGAEGDGAVASAATDPGLGEPPRAFDVEALEGLRRDAEAGAAGLV